MEKRQPTTKPVGTGCLADRGQDAGLHAMSSEGAGTRLTSQQLVGLAPEEERELLVCECSGGPHGALTRRDW